jgi:hypothetical protein
MVQAVSRHRLTAKARVNPRGICGAQSGTASDFSQLFSVFPYQYHSTEVLRSHIISGMNNRPIDHRQSDFIDMNNNSNIYKFHLRYFNTADYKQNTELLYSPLILNMTASWDMAP